MSIAAMVLALVSAGAFVAAGVMKVLMAAPARADAERFGILYTPYRGIGVLEILGGAGLATGALVASFWWLGVAAAVGLVALTTGALATHLRVGDPVGKAVGAPIFGILSAITGILIYLDAA